jgi:hypothetical protein
LLISKVKKKQNEKKKGKGREGRESFEGHRGGFRAGQRNPRRSGGRVPPAKAK